MKTPLPTSTCPNTDGTMYRILAFLASVRPIRGSADSADEDYYRGRSIIERMAISSEDTDSPTIKLTAEHCASVLQFLANVEPFEPKTWWQDSDEGPSHLVGYVFVLQTLRANLQPAEEQQS
jgi:hypothetical protein